MRKIKRKDYENLSPENLEKVLALMNPEGQEKPITKKEACEILNISYNTTRLNKILEDYLEQKEYTKIRKAKNRGKPASSQEIAEIAQEYLSGESIAEIAKGLYRSPSFVKSVIEKVGIPFRAANKEERRYTAYLPDNCTAEEFEPGEIVWSARHHRAAIVEHELSVDYQAERAGFSDVNYEKKYGSKCYAIYVLEDIDHDKEFWIQGIETGGYKAFSLAYDLGKLEHLKEYGVDLSRI